MKRFLTPFLLTCAAIVHAADAPPPGGIIFDTDMGGDCDDVGALFLLHGAVQRGEARLLGTMAVCPRAPSLRVWMPSIRGSVGLLFPWER